jgi:SAM-dependent methyltransferase
MIWALFNDILQRLLTFNKQQQKEYLFRLLRSLQLPPGRKILDFGCGTALFADVCRKAGCLYHGYDIDSRLISYASRLYDQGRFTDSREQLKKEGPFDLILANCCFHHIDDASLAEELEEMKALLKSEGTFIMIDILLPRNDHHLARRLFRKLETGAHVRSQEEYRALVEKQFIIRKSDIERSHLFSIRSLPIYNDLAILQCRIRG